MGERLAIYFPFALAVLFPPVGLILGLVGLQEDRETGVRLLVVSALALVVWLFIFLV